MNVTQSFLQKSGIAGLALAASIGLAGSAVAQDATPSASPASVSVACSTPTAGTPESTPMATPETQTAETVTDQATIDAATSAVSQCAEGATDIQVVQVMQYGDGSIGVEYRYLMDKQVMQVSHTFMVEGDMWTTLNSEMVRPTTEMDSATVAVQVSDGLVEANIASFPLNGALRLQATNNTAGDVTMVVYLAGDSEFDVATLEGTTRDSAPEGLQQVGAILAPTGSTTDLLFEGLDQGTYVIVAYDADGNMVGAGTLVADAPTSID